MKRQLWLTSTNHASITELLLFFAIWNNCNTNFRCHMMLACVGAKSIQTANAENLSIVVGISFLSAIEQDLQLIPVGRPQSWIFCHVTCTGRHFIVTGVLSSTKPWNSTLTHSSSAELRTITQYGCMQLQFSAIFYLGHVTYSSIVIRHVVHIKKLRNDLLLILQKLDHNRLSVTVLIAKCPSGIFPPSLCSGMWL